MLTILLLALQIPLCKAQVRTFEIDPGSSDISFEVTHLGFLTVEGSFLEFSGKCISNGDSLLSLEGKIKVISINTNDEARDASLKSEGYLDIENFPLITFSSTEITDSAESQLVTGQLKIKDQVRVLKMPLYFNLSEDGKSCSIEATTTISREDFELDFGAMDALVGDEVRMMIMVHGKLQ